MTNRETIYKIQIGIDTLQQTAIRLRNFLAPCGEIADRNLEAYQVGILYDALNDVVIRLAELEALALDTLFESEIETRSAEYGKD